MSTKAYEIVTARLIEMLENGTVPWRKGWASAGAPQNGHSKRRYRGINAFLLGLSGYADNRWLTFNQVKELGGFVQAGSKATPVVFWKWLEIEDKETGKPVEIPFLKHYYVFNLEQTQNVKLPPLESVGLPCKAERLEAAEEIVRSMPQAPAIKHDGGERAYYRPSTDSVHMPSLQAFYGTEEYYSTLFHELGHSTGHESRLARSGITEIEGFGTASYSKEELVAEFTASFLCNHIGLENDALMANHAAYLDSWLSVLRKDVKMAVVAASQAQKAADFILGVANESETD